MTFITENWYARIHWNAHILAIFPLGTQLRIGNDLDSQSRTKNQNKINKQTKNPQEIIEGNQKQQSALVESSRLT